MMNTYERSADESDLHAQINLNKHAYLIIAYNNFNLLKKLLEAIDDERNDIYLHIGSDAKINPDEFTSVCKHSSLYPAEKRMNTIWRSRVLIDVTLMLMKQAVNTYDYSYLHLLSGQDFPIKSQDYIHSFFNENDGEEYVDIWSRLDKFDSRTISSTARVRYYHFFTLLHKFRKGLFGRFCTDLYTFLDKNSMMVQKIFRINRLLSHEYNVYMGSEWFSITGKCAKYILSRIGDINKMLPCTCCVDELIIQTFVMDSPFKDAISKSGNMRYVTISGSHAHSLGVADLESMLNSDKLFARKFDEGYDKAVIDVLIGYILKK